MQESVTKVFLYAYPLLDGLAEASETAAYHRAVLSYCKPRVMEAALGVLEEATAAGALRALKADMDRLIMEFSEEEGRLAAFKYFRTRKSMPRLTERTYYRRQQQLLKKAERILSSYGWTDERFLEEFGGYAPFTRLLTAVQEKKIPAHRPSSESGGG